MIIPKHIQAADIIRAQIADGTLKPGSPAPSGAAVARVTGFAKLTCRKAIEKLITDGTLVPGPSRNSRPRVALGPAPAGQTCAVALSAALADRRRAAGLTQGEFAALAGCSVTTIGHAETGRLWQSRRFWENADTALNSGGSLLTLHNDYRAAANSRPAASPPAGNHSPLAPPTLRYEKFAVIAAPLGDRDPLVLRLLTLATETMLAHPEALPAALIAMLDAYAADLTDALGPATRRD